MTSQNNEFPPLFLPVDTDWINNARIVNGHYRSEFYILGYKQAADILVNHVLSTGYDQDTLVYPIVFLYRHDLELLVKNIIENGAKYLDIEEKPKTNHYLDTLWTTAKGIINKIWEEKIWEEGESYQELEIDHYIAEFIKIDKSSQAFRYHKDKEGKEFLELTEIINIQHFSDCINKISIYLEGVSAAIYHYLETQKDSDYM
ncbi:hypothetical protein [Trichormus variabilis]|uniref:HEPN domain-containing protein n=1 Tax=Trichormus variabilis SAG 1403-4b TaxID=447716 RepID=A0A433UI39_ANAVA|nr:hypothetical protein [Trichormus variabilis]MBD2629350.1 hypothetical protein [Trichormus variabilis FACHB-164]RUS93508.1 hypothetical protein DSM107003_43040 [Trichormus variabilis SAG 1403-4b]